MKPLVLGIGNLLLADEGVGCHVAKMIRPWGDANGVTVIDAGTAITEVLDEIGASSFVVVIDAMKGGGTPGTIYRVPLEECEKKDYLAGMHGFNILHVMALLGGERIPKAIVIGIEPEKIEWSLELSGAVQNALPDVAEAVKKEIQSP